MLDFVIILLSFLSAFVITFIAIPPIIRVSIIRELYDKPDTRKNHKHNIPTLGGVSIFAGFLISSVFWTAMIMAREGQYIFASMLIMFFIGIKDDIVPLSPLKKLIGQVIAVSIVVLFANIKMRSLYGFMGVYELSPLTDNVVSILFLLTIINAYNFIDGIDGLAGSIGAIIVTSFGCCFWVIHDQVSAVLAFSILGALLAFLKYNFTPAKIFMGDTGSLIVGLVIGILALKILGDDGHLIPHYARIFGAIGHPLNFVIAVLIIPITDTIRVTIIRLLKQKSPFLPDNNHIHHLLVGLGLSHIQSSLILCGINLLFIIICLLMKQINAIAVFITIASVASTFSVFIYICKNIKKSNYEAISTTTSH